MKKWGGMNRPLDFFFLSFWIFRIYYIFIIGMRYNQDLFSGQSFNTQDGSSEAEAQRLHSNFNGDNLATSRLQPIIFSGVGTSSYRGGKSPSPTPPTLLRNLFSSSTLHSTSSIEAILNEQITGKEEKFKDHYRWIISSVIFQQVTDARNDFESFVSLNFETLRAIVSKKKCTSFLFFLKSKGIIESDNHFIRGFKSIGYRLADLYRREQIISFPLKDQRLLAKIKRWKEKLDQSVADLPTGYAHVKYWSQELRIDLKAVRSRLLASYNPNGDEYASRLFAASLIDQGQYFFTVDGKAGRAHHNLTNLAYDLRDLVTIQGRTLSQVDIANSQPLFFHLTVRNSPRIDPTERERMEALVTTGTFYEAFNTAGVDRYTFKQEFFRDVLFGRNRIETPTSKLFAEQFPSYWAVIKDFKKNDHARLAVEMQKTEAKFIYHLVEEFSKATNYSVPVLTIHDSLVTTTEQLPLAEQLMREKFREVYGVEVTLKGK